MSTRVAGNGLSRRSAAVLLLAVSAAAASASVMLASLPDVEADRVEEPRLILLPKPERPAATPLATGNLTPHIELPAPIPASLAVATAVDAEEWRFADACTLRLQKKTLPLPGAVEQGGPREVDVLNYNGRLVGPTIRVRRGATINIKLINELPQTGAPIWTGATDQRDAPHDMYTTNLHTHGLHVSPEGKSDNVFREIPPGESYQYRFTIPADHPSGTYWYHPHKHGSVAYQLGNGLAGALIVEGHPADKISDLEDIPEIASAKEQVLMLQQMVLRTDADGFGRVDPSDSYNDPDPTAYRVTAVNGQVLPTYTMSPLEVQRWRFIGAGREGSAMLCWYDDHDQRVNSMPFYEIAVDGLATGKLTARYSVTMIPGKRSDCLVKAPQRRGTYYLATHQEDESPGANEKLIVKYLARLVVQGVDRPMGFPSADRLAACKPFEPVEPSACRVKRHLVFSFDDKKRNFHINGLPFSEQSAPDRPLLGSAEEWTLSALDAPAGTPNEPHPFHIHVNPFEVIQIEDLRTKVRIKVHEWRDTYAVEPGKKVTIRMRFNDFPGKTVLHCHTLDHEDQGMMRTIEIVDPARPDSGSNESSPLLTDCFAPTPPLELRTAEGTLWNLQTAGDRRVILVFFRGMQCSHCVRELRELLREAAGLAGTGTLVLAVSSEPIADLANVVKSLQGASGVDFRLLVDEQRLAFRNFGCFDDHPLHGLFVIDKEGVLRARYSGESPYDNPQDVCTRICQLIDLERQMNPEIGVP